MAKIVTISLVKNSADIIESFVRHSLTFSDEMLIADHNSTDGTREILAQLKNEGLPIRLTDYRQVELAHAEVMNFLLAEAVWQYGADFVLPLDADEFLANFETDETIRTCIETLSRQALYYLHWYVFRPQSPETDADKFLLSRPAYKGKNFAAAQKMLIGADRYRQAPFHLVQGAHAAYTKLNASGQYDPVAASFAPKLAIAHYHWRSAKQYIAKAMTGWLENVAKYSLTTASCDYFKDCFERAITGKMAKETRENVSPPLENYEPWDWTGRLPQPIETLRYSHLIHIDAVYSALKTAELIAQSYAEEKILKRKKTLLYLVFSRGDSAALNRTLDSLKSSVYPFSRLFVIELGENSPPSPLPLKGRYIEGATPAEKFSSLASLATEDYVQWLMAGDVIEPTKTIRQITSIECFDNGRLDFLLAAGNKAKEKETPFYYLPPKDLKPLIFIDQHDLLMPLIYDGLPFYSGLAGAMFRRQVLERVNYFADCWLGDSFYEFSAWEKLCPAGRLAGLSPDALVERTRPLKREYEDLLWFYIEWPLYLKAAIERAEKIGDAEQQKMLFATSQTYKEKALRLAHLAKVNGASANLANELITAAAASGF